MNISNILAGALIAGGLAATSASASTTQLQFNGAFSSVPDAGFRGATVSVQGALAGGFTDKSVGIGGFDMQEVTSGGLGDSFVAWCVDLFDWINGGSPAVTNPITYSHDPIDQLAEGTTLARVQAYFDENFTEAVAISRDQSAGFQLGLWEVVYDTDYNLTTFGGAQGFKGTSGNTAALSAAQSFLMAAADGYAGPQKWILTQWNGEDNVNTNSVDVDAQDLVSVSAIPVPAGVLLIVSAFGVAGAVRRRSTARA